MTGFVPHANRDELHGITVVVELRDGRTLVGRWHEKTHRGVLLHDVGVYDPASVTIPKEEWFGKLLKFGVPVAQKHILIPDDQFVGVRRFSE